MDSSLSIFKFAETKMLICFKAQYVYLHEALADALLMMIQHVQTDQFPSVVRHMLGKDKTSAKTRVEEQFQVNIKSQTIYFILYFENNMLTSLCRQASTLMSIGRTSFLCLQWIKRYKYGTE